MHDWVVAAVALDVDDPGFAGRSSLRILDAVADCGVIRRQVTGGDDYLQILDLVQTVIFLGVYRGDQSLEGGGGVACADRSSRCVVGVGSGC